MKDEKIVFVDIFDISPNRDQPRKHFDSEKLKELSESIKTHGIVQPIIVRRVEDEYEIVAGERRWRAARLLGLRKVPVIVKDITDLELAEIALVENIQREDLNPIEEAMAFKVLLEQYHLTQESIAKQIGKSRSHIANTVRLLKLDSRVRELLIENKLTSGHGRTILGLNNSKRQLEVAKLVIEKTLSVRETEDLVRRYNNKSETKFKYENSPLFKNLEESLMENLGTKVSIVNRKNKGKIIVEYYSEEELERLIELINK